VGAVQKQLRTTNKVSLAFDRWTSTNKLAMASGIGNYMDQNWALREVQFAFDEVNCLFFFYLNS